MKVMNVLELRVLIATVTVMMFGMVSRVSRVSCGVARVSTMTAALAMCCPAACHKNRRQRYQKQHEPQALK
jgi:hypothetical protein